MCGKIFRVVKFAMVYYSGPLYFIVVHFLGTSYSISMIDVNVLVCPPYPNADH